MTVIDRHDYSDGSRASCMHSIKNIRLQWWLSSCWLLLNLCPCTHILMTTLWQHQYMYI